MNKQEEIEQINLIKSNIDLQLTEIEILKSIYSNDDEFLIEDQDAFIEAQLFIANKTDSSQVFARNIGFIIKINAQIFKEELQNSAKHHEEDNQNTFCEVN